MPERRKLFVHVGLQKTGTSYLQASLLGGAAGLAGAGLDLVPPTKRQCFELMVVVRDRYGARRDPDSDRRIWERFTQQLHEAPGDRAVFSQESLAAAGPGQLRRLLEACADREVHVVVTVRDLARAIPSAWQEELKAGGTVTLDRYVQRLQRLEQEGRGRLPWIHLDAPTVLDRWSEALGADRMHVVTVPPPGSSPTLLLERFARVLEVDPGLMRPEDSRSNSSLGLVQAEVLRRVNAELPEEVHRRYIYSDVVKRSFGAKVLGAQERRKILLPAQLREWCETVAQDQVRRIEESGYHVEGSLADLRCEDSAFTGVDQTPSEDEVAAASVTALSAMLARQGRAEAQRRDGRIEVRPRRLPRRLLDRLVRH